MGYGADIVTAKDAVEAADARNHAARAHWKRAAVSGIAENLTRLALEFKSLLPSFNHLESVSLGAVPHNYRDHGAQVPVEPLHELFTTCHERLAVARG
jgi:hypothetical protein